MPPLTAQQILDADDLGTARVDVPEWGEGAYVLVRNMTAKERGAWEGWGSKVAERKDFSDVRAKLCSLCICDEQRQRVFDDKQMEQLSAKSGIVLDRIYDAAHALNALGAAEVKELEKNSESGPSAASP